MSEKTSIEWTDHTWSPWEGCQKVGPGCDHCYAEARNARFAGAGRRAPNWGSGAPRRRTVDWTKPRLWNRQAERDGVRRRVFPSLCDPFDNAVDPTWRDDLWQLIKDTPNLDWLLLTKRIGNVFQFLPDGWAFGHMAWPNVWLGATVVNQAEADRDIPKLLSIPARVRFLSMEPLLGPVDLGMPLNVSQYEDGGAWSPRNLRSHDTGIHWVIAGGESGVGARPSHQQWYRTLRDQCAAAGCPFLFKQWGEWLPIGIDDSFPGKRQIFRQDSANRQIKGYLQITREHQQDFGRVGKSVAGRVLDGLEHNGFPAVHYA